MRNTPTSRSKAGGQSLVEYLICLALIVGAGTVLLSTSWDAVRLALQARHQSFAFHLGQP